VTKTERSRQNEFIPTTLSTGFARSPKVQSGTGVRDTSVGQWLCDRGESAAQSGELS